MRRVISLAVLLIVFATSLAFAVLNTEPVELDYYFGAWHLPLALLIGIAIVIGAALGVLASIGMVLRSKREAARLRKEVQYTTDNPTNMRAVPINEVS